MSEVYREFWTDPTSCYTCDYRKRLPEPGAWCLKPHPEPRALCEDWRAIPLQRVGDDTFAIPD